MCVERIQIGFLINKELEFSKSKFAFIGIPMEMTAGQIMEAEISASTLGLEDDDNTVQPQEPATSSSKISYQDHLGSETLPEDLFTSDVNQPPSPAAAATVQVSNLFFASISPTMVDHLKSG